MIKYQMIGNNNMDRLIKYGDKGELVKILQAHLNSLGNDLVVDGIFGKKTLKANNGITVCNIDTLECNLRLERIQKEDCTVGKLYLNKEYVCDTLEDKFREKKIPNETCIPYGTYKVIINNSPKFKRLMPRLLDVPNFEGILIHDAGTSKKGIEYTSGCILVYRKMKDGKLLDSKQVFNELFNRLKNYKNITITIV